MRKRNFNDKTGEKMSLKDREEKRLKKASLTVKFEKR